MKLALPSSRARVRRWARRSANPKGAALEEEIRSQLPEVMRRLGHYRIPTTAGGRPVARSALTRLQRELREATESSTQVAQDNLLQQFRKSLHLLFDH